MSNDAAPQTRRVAAGAITLAARDWGGPDGAPGMVLVHGLASNAQIWDLVAPQLMRDYRVVAIDQRGHGVSDKPAHGYDLPTAVADVRAACAACFTHPPLLVGHSWGAHVVLQFAVEEPSRCAGVVLVDGAISDLAARLTLPEALERLAPPRLAGMRRSEFLERVRQRWPAAAWDEPVARAILANFAIDADDCITPHLTFERHLQLLEALWHQRPTHCLGKVAVPLTAIVAAPAAHDPATAPLWQQRRAAVAALTELAPHADVHWLADTLHDIPLHRPAVLAQLLRAAGAAR